MNRGDRKAEKGTEAAKLRKGQKEKGRETEKQSKGERQKDRERDRDRKTKNCLLYTSDAADER